MERVNGIFTLMISRTILAKATNETEILNNIKVYQQIIRSIIYMMISTWPDLTFMIS